MNQEKRQSTRYNEIGKVSSPELCALPGILENISVAGCRVFYGYPVVVDLDSEYTLEVLPASQYDKSPLKLRCRPQWVNEKEGNTFIGFEMLYSPDAARLAEFISSLENSEKDPFNGNTSS